LDYITSQHSNVNAQRIHGLGASYGGWMVNWLNGHTNRFRSLVCHDGIFDQRMLYFETEELWFPEHDMEGNPLNATAALNYNVRVYTHLLSIMIN
jgi:dipeptidyl aminopeptidase/acylaminoacyl peptidase